MATHRMSEDGKTLIVEIPWADKMKYNPHDEIMPTRFPMYNNKGVDINPFSYNNLDPNIKIQIIYTDNNGKPINIKNANNRQYRISKSS